MISALAAEETPALAVAPPPPEPPRWVIWAGYSLAALLLWKALIPSDALAGLPTHRRRRRRRR